jgi:hypothetical protein
MANSAPPPAEDSPSRREATPLHGRRSGVPGRCCRAAVPGSMDELPGGPGHAPQVAPRALEAARAPVPPSRSPSAGSRDQAPDPSTRSGEPQVGLPQDQRRAPEARRRRLRHDHRHGASPRWPQPGPPPDRTDLEQFLRLQAYGLLSPGPPSEEEEEEDALEALVWDPHREAPTPVSENPAATEHDEPIHDGTTPPTGQPIATVGTRPHASLTQIPASAGTRARDRPAMAA